MEEAPREDGQLRIVLATRNPHKVDELAAMLSDLPIEVLSCRDFPDIPEVIEDGATLEENAAKKATAIADATGLPALADDTGLEVDALDGAPGVFSARYAGENATYDDNNRKLLAELVDIPRSRRFAVFRCVAALAKPGGELAIAEGRTRGVIVEAPRGEAGFGYDPLFLPEGCEHTYAEMTPTEKNAASHRGKAMRAAREFVEAMVSGAASGQEPQA